MADSAKNSNRASDESLCDDIVRAVRRILRRTAEHSRQLAREGDLSVSQLLCLRKVAQATKSQPVTVAEVSAAVQLSNATVSRILDRLETAELIVRERGELDRRKVFLWLTPVGKRHVKKLPMPLHDRFMAGLSKLPRRRQRELLASLDEIVELMDAADLDVAPLLSPETDVRGTDVTASPGRT